MFDRLDKALERTTMALAVVGCAIVVALFALVIVDVSIRASGVSPPRFTVAVVEYGLLYFAMFAAPFLVRQRGHVCIEAVIAMLPRSAQVTLAQLVYFVCITATLLFAYFSTQLVIDALRTSEIDLRGIDVPLWLQYAPMPVGFTLVALEFVPYLMGRRSYYNYDLGAVKDTV